jgi:hypothetical protein
MLDYDPRDNGTQSRLLATVGAFRVESCPRGTSRSASGPPAIHALPTSDISGRAGSFRPCRYRETEIVSSR